MKTWLIGGVVGMGLLALTGVYAQRKADPKANGWQSDLQAARQLARQTGKPLMVVFRCEP